MDERKRPVRREKNISGKSGTVEKRGSGMHSGEGAERGSGPQNRAGGGLGGVIAGMVLKEAVAEATGRKKSKGMLVFLALAAVVVIFVMMSGAMGGSDYTESTGSQPTISNSSSGTGFASSGTGSFGSASGAVLNTRVSPLAREKRTVIQGNGKDIVTIMVYMCGTDLESRSGMATRDLQEMLNAELGSKVNLLVFTGGCKQWKNNVISSTNNQIYQIQNGQMRLLTEQKSNRAMTDPALLSAFIKWGKENFPADRYDLILWDHGGGSTSGYGYDEQKATSGSMTLDKLDTALRDGGCVFDFIGFDACLMATLETALVAEPYADYLIASEETEPGVGWYYTNWLSALAENTSMPTLEIGKNIIDDFVNTCAQQAQGQKTTLSITDLAELKGTVPDSFAEFASSTTALIRGENYQQVSDARSGSREFAVKNRIDQVDLADLAERMNTEEGAKLAEVIVEAVKYNRTSSDITHANGLSVYFPYGSSRKVNQMADTYEKIGIDDSYTECIRSFASLEVAGQTVAGGSSSQLESLFGMLTSGSTSGSTSSGSSVGSDAVTQLLMQMMQGRSLANVGLDEESARFVDEDLVQQQADYLAENSFAGTKLRWMDHNGESILALSEEQWKLIQTVELNVFVDDGSGYIDLGLDNVYELDEDGNLCGTYDKTWLAINDQFVAYYLESAEEAGDGGYEIMGRVPAILNGEQKVDLILRFTDENPKGEVLGARIAYDLALETETEAKGLLEINDGDTLDFICEYYDYNRNYQDSYYLGRQLKVSGALEISNMSMENSDYIASYRLTDLYNNHYWTPAV